MNFSSENQVFGAFDREGDDWSVRDMKKCLRYFIQQLMRENESVTDTVNFGEEKTQYNR